MALRSPTAAAIARGLERKHLAEVTAGAGDPIAEAVKLLRRTDADFQNNLLKLVSLERHAGGRALPEFLGLVNRMIGDLKQESQERNGLPAALRSQMDHKMLGQETTLQSVMEKLQEQLGIGTPAFQMIEQFMKVLLSLNAQTQVDGKQARQAQASRMHIAKRIPGGINKRPLIGGTNGMHLQPLRQKPMPVMAAGGAPGRGDLRPGRGMFNTRTRGIAV